MTLARGTRLGPYEVTGTLGAGGMGEVYRAHDTKLNRAVALKVLPDAFAADPDRLARFQREAQVLASLNHPHIGAIYGFEESPSTEPVLSDVRPRQAQGERSRRAQDRLVFVRWSSSSLRARRWPFDWADLPTSLQELRRARKVGPYNNQT